MSVIGTVIFEMAGKRCQATFGIDEKWTVQGDESGVIQRVLNAGFRIRPEDTHPAMGTPGYRTVNEAARYLEGQAQFPEPGRQEGIVF